MLIWCTNLPATHLSFLSINNYHFTLMDFTYSDDTFPTLTIHDYIKKVLTIRIHPRPVWCSQFISSWQLQLNLFYPTLYNPECSANGKFTKTHYISQFHLLAAPSPACPSSDWLQQTNITLFHSPTSCYLTVDVMHSCILHSYFLQKWKECTIYANIHHQIFKKVCMSCMSHTISVILSTGA